MRQMFVALKAEARGDKWWDQLNRQEQLVYIKAHPKSIYRNKIRNDEQPSKIAAKPVDTSTKNIQEPSSIADIEQYDVTLKNRADQSNYLKEWNDVVGVKPENIFEGMFPYFIGKKRIEKDNEFFDGEYVEGFQLKFKDEDIDAQRLFYKRYDGRKAVHHSFFLLPKSDQGRGFAKKFLKDSVDTYKKMGIKIVDTQANIDVGSYAWPKYGFVPTKKAWKSLKVELLRILNAIMDYESPSISEEDAYYIRNLLESYDPKTVWKIADISKPIKGGISIGKKLLMDRSYDAELNLEDPEVMKRFDTYVGKSNG